MKMFHLAFVLAGFLLGGLAGGAVTFNIVFWYWLYQKFRQTEN